MAVFAACLLAAALALAAISLAVLASAIQQAREGEEDEAGFRPVESPIGANPSVVVAARTMEACRPRRRLISAEPDSVTTGR